MPSPPNPPDADERGAPPADFEWPPRDELSVHEIQPRDLAGHWRRPQDGAGDGRPVAADVAWDGSTGEDVAAEPGHGEPDAEDRHRAWPPAPMAAAIAAAAIIAVGAGLTLSRSVSAPVPAEAAPLPTVTVVPAPPVAAAPPLPGPTIRLTYPVDPLPAETAPDAAPAATRPSPWPASPAESASSRTGVFEAVGETARPIAGPTVPAAPGPASASLASPAAAAIAGAPGLPVPSPVAAVAPSAMIRGVLARYEDAYDRRDVETATALWPSLDRRALTRAFASLDRQDVDFDRCDIDVDGRRGSAVCVGSVRYVPSVGRGVEKSDRITWRFDLLRSGEDWRIVGLQAR